MNEETNNTQPPAEGPDEQQQQQQENARQETKQQQEEKQQAVPDGTQAPDDLFDLIGDSGKPYKKKADLEAKVSQASKGAADKGGKAVGKQPLKKYPAGKELHYSGHKLTLPSEMTEAEVFAYLSDDFPELTTERAEIREDSAKGRLVIALKSFKEGSSLKTPRTLEVLEDPPALGAEESYTPVFRLLGEDGVYEVRKSGAGTFIAKVPSNGKVLEGFYPAVPKAPTSLLARTVAIFKQMPDKEAVVNVVYDRHEEEFHLVWADQRDATSGGVTYDPIPETERMVPYVEVHSHNIMAPFFSQTDDEYELRSGLYGVVGHVDRPLPAAAFRFSCGGVFRSLAAADVFTDSADANEPPLFTTVRDVPHPKR